MNGWRTTTIVLLALALVLGYFWLRATGDARSANDLADEYRQRTTELAGQLAAAQDALARAQDSLAASQRAADRAASTATGLAESLGRIASGDTAIDRLVDSIAEQIDRLAEALRRDVAGAQQVEGGGDSWVAPGADSGTVGSGEVR